MFLVPVRPSSTYFSTSSGTLRPGRRLALGRVPLCGDERTKLEDSLGSGGPKFYPRCPSFLLHSRILACEGFNANAGCGGLVCLPCRLDSWLEFCYFM